MPQAFTVVNQSMQLVKNGLGNNVSGYRVTAQLPSGTTFFVDVPASQYEPDTVKQMLRDEAAKIGALEGYSE